MTKQSEEKFVLGFDLGGTKVAVGLIDLKGRLIYSKHEPTPIDSGPNGVCKKMLVMFEEALCKTLIPPKEIIGAGIGAGGPLDLEKGMLLSPPNLPNFHKFPIRDVIEKGINMKVILDNDANAAALGEKMFGAGKNKKNLIYITVSTGIGGGIIVNGKVLHGVRYSAGEVGHMTLNPEGPRCNCGNYGCLEALSSGTGIAKQAKQSLRENPTSLILDLVKGDKDKIDAEVVFKAAGMGDKLASYIIDKALFYLGIGIGNLITAFSPEIVILGGGITKVGDRLFIRIREVVRERVKLVPVKLIPIVKAELGENVGVIGAGSLIINEVLSTSASKIDTLNLDKVKFF